MRNRDKKGVFLEHTIEEFENNFHNILQPLVKGKAINVKDIDKNTKNKLVHFGRKHLNTNAYVPVLVHLGYEPTSTIKENKKKEREETLKKNIQVFNQEQGLLKNNYTNTAKLPSILQSKIKTFGKNYLETNSIHKTLEHLGFATTKNNQPTPHQIGKQLYNRFITGKNISSDALRHESKETQDLEYLIKKNNIPGTVNLQVKFNGKKGWGLAKKVPQSLKKKTHEYNNKEYETIQKDEIVFLLEIAKRYDKKFQEVKQLWNAFTPNVTQVTTAKSQVTYRNEAGNFSTKADIRTTTRGLETLIKIVTGEDIEESYHIHSEFSCEKSADYWSDNKKIDKKVIVVNAHPELVKQEKKEAEKKGFTIISGHELKKAYNKSLELLEREEPNFLVKVATNHDYMSKIIHYLQPFIPHIQKKDIETSWSRSASVGTIAEEELRLILNTAKLYPEEHIPHINDFFKGDIKKIYGPQDQYEVSIMSNETGMADFRIQSDEETLVEVKKYNRLRRPDTRRIIQKYCTAKNWADGNTIDNKLLVFNSKTTGLEGNKEQFKEVGFTVWNGKEVSEAYQAAINILLQHNPTFFTDNEMPIPGKEEDAKKTILTIHDMIHNESHLLERNGMRFYKQWAQDLLKNVNKNIIQGVKPRKNVTIIKNFKKEYITPFNKEQSFYKGINLDELLIEEALFIDLETAGSIRTGNPTIINGLAYAKDGEMIIHQLFSRNPTEERYINERFMELAEGKKYLVDFSGTWFDQPFLKERFIAHGMPYPDIEHVDLRKIFNTYLERNDIDIPKKKLQTYEKIILDIHRKNDIKGELIPKIYKDFLYQGNVKGMEMVIKHSIYDMITMAIMYDHFDKEKLVPKPENYQQAELF